MVLCMIDLFCFSCRYRQISVSCWHTVGGKMYLTFQKLLNLKSVYCMSISKIHIDVKCILYVYVPKWYIGPF